MAMPPKKDCSDCSANRSFGFFFSLYQSQSPSPDSCDREKSSEILLHVGVSFSNLVSGFSTFQHPPPPLTIKGLNVYESFSSLRFHSPRQPSGSRSPYSLPHHESPHDFLPCWCLPVPLLDAPLSPQSLVGLPFPSLPRSFF